MAIRGYDILTRLEATPKKITELVKEHKSFKITQVGKDMIEFSQKVENVIDSAGYKCRLYTGNRFTSVMVGLIPNPVTWGIGIFSAVGIALHNIATYDPDYAISRHLWDDTVKVSYQRGYDG